MANAGLELELSVSALLFNEAESTDVIDIFVNGTQVASREFGKAWDGSIIITPEELLKAADGDVYDIEIYCSKSFRPSALGINADNRDLAIQVKYVGCVR